MDKLVLDSTEVSLIRDLVCDYRKGVRSGTIVPDEPRDEAIEAADALLRKLEKYSEWQHN